jgi:hypothetical protein
MLFYLIDVLVSFENFALQLSMPLAGTFALTTQLLSELRI